MSTIVKILWIVVLSFSVIGLIALLSELYKTIKEITKAAKSEKQMFKPEKQMIDNFNKRFKKLTTTTDETKLPQWTSVD
jgi:uncharacterized protein (UPF0305 family)